MYTVDLNPNALIFKKKKEVFTVYIDRSFVFFLLIIIITVPDYRIN